MPFGMAGLDFAFGIRTETERKPFCRRSLLEKFMHPDACCTEQI